MRHWITQIIVLLILSTMAGVAVNALRPDGISFIGRWPSRTGDGSGPVVPPSAQPGDAPFVTLNEAVVKYQSPGIIFIDARSPEDFAAGHIVRSINIPYDFLDDSWEQVINGLDRAAEYVIYCSGGECESSLLLSRHLSGRGFNRLSVFFGGWQEWIDNRLPVTTPEGVSEVAGS